MNDAPLAGRLRRPGWKDPRLLIGLFLIAASVVGVSAMVRSADVTTPYYAAKTTLTPGTVLTDTDLVVVNARLGGGDYVAPGDEPWGRVVTRVVGKGEMLPAAALAEAEHFDSRTVAVQTTLPLAAGVKDGSVVDVFVTNEAANGEPHTSKVGGDLVVESVERSGGSFSSSTFETVYVVVPRGEIETLLDALAGQGDISVVGIAGSAR